MAAWHKISINIWLSRHNNLETDHRQNNRITWKESNRDPSYTAWIESITKNVEIDSNVFTFRTVQSELNTIFNN